jgi:hypothetical protein
LLAQQKESFAFQYLMNKFALPLLLDILQVGAQKPVSIGGSLFDKINCGRLSSCEILWQLRKLEGACRR